MEQKNAWLSYTAAQKRELEKLSGEYLDFLSNGKTERECADIAVNAAEAAGYKNLRDLIKGKKKVKAGDRIYDVCMGKSVVLFNIGSDDIEKGMNILGAHIDSPRMDVKQNPLYEDGELAYLDTHYYGGI
ncbi:MAG: aminopeptidase, partial [Lachnospiraceae bacterium]|nr:aminopeptidase [Lachnospiraceae bacterium]